MPDVSVRQALQAVADHPIVTTDEMIQLPVHELVSRALFEIANNPDQSVRGSMSRANKARKMIFDRLVGKRRPGTAPAAKTTTTIEFVDLTAGAIAHVQDAGVPTHPAAAPPPPAQEAGVPRDGA